MPDPIPLRDALIGASDAENQKHLIVREAFLRELVNDTRVQTFLAECDQSVGVAGAYSRSAAVREAVDRIKQVPISQRPHNPTVSAALRIVFDGIDDRALAARLENFTVRTLGLLWPWVSLELTSIYVANWTARLSGSRVTIDRVLARSASFSFTARQGESLEEMQQRLAAEYQGRPDQLPKGRRPKNKAYLEEYARWFYRVKVKYRPDSIRLLAREAISKGGGAAPTDQPGSYDGRKAVQYGVAEAERLLGLTPYKYRSQR